MFKTMYSKTEAAIRLNDKITKWFETAAGVRQVQNDSPIAFLIFINSLAKNIKYLNKCVKYVNNMISILLYTDDIIFLAETKDNLQSMLIELSAWCNKWRMLINTGKIKLFILDPKDTGKKVQFTMNSTTLEIVEKYKYLGCTLNEHLDMKITGNVLAEGHLANY